MSHPIIINYNQARHSDRKIYLGSLESRTEVLRGLILRNSNDGISINPLINIGGIIPQVTGQGIFKIFDPIKGM